MKIKNKIQTFDVIWCDVKLVMWSKQIAKHRLPLNFFTKISNPVFINTTTSNWFFPQINTSIKSDRLLPSDLCFLPKLVSSEHYHSWGNTVKNRISIQYFLRLPQPIVTWEKPQKLNERPYPISTCSKNLVLLESLGWLFECYLVFFGAI